MSDAATTNALKDISRGIQEQNRILKDMNKNLSAISKVLSLDLSQENLERYIKETRERPTIVNT